MTSRDDKIREQNDPEWYAFYNYPIEAWCCNTVRQNSNIPTFIWSDEPDEITYITALWPCEAGLDALDYKINRFLTNAIKHFGARVMAVPCVLAIGKDAPRIIPYYNMATRWNYE